MSTAYEMGWAQLSNGALLQAAETQFDVFITADQNLRHQQKITGNRPAILVLPTTSWPKISGHQGLIAATVDKLCAGDMVEMKFP